ncbi:DNA polymerase IV [Paenibacillus ginsengarvi]|uniref:DNA polymerase IV n=1 Tax=Paenibacillus ginsengarvi TaxID=400777 RepID=A0A3B0BSJ0_9BACL|nr:DNA polymerase IV [Paenibacillus ginsengarvi]RKN74977.1 DNA polymerase IV [Paenibacillus ginsengarvi]
MKNGAFRRPRVVFLADCQSFYASVEKAHRPELEGKPVVVAGDPERRSGIILAACPIAKSFGVTTAETIRESLAKCPQLEIIKPRMQLYIDVSLQITEIYERFSDLVEPFSIDEQFVDVSASTALYGDPTEIARAIQSQVWNETRVRTRVGIGENKILAKMACDNFAKKNESGIYELKKEELADTLWQLPINKMFMVGSRMTQHFNQMGITTIGELARIPLEQFKARLGRKFGRNSDINAEVLWRIANGHDQAPVSPFTFETQQKAIGHMMTLPFDYRKLDDIKVVLLELSELVCQRVRSKGLMGQVVSAGCQGADFDQPTGFHRQMKMQHNTNLTEEVYEVVCEIFAKHWNEQPVRKVGVTLSELTADETYQMTVFPDREKKMALERATDEIKSRFGNASIMRASSVSPAGQAQRRAGMIGGHNK